MVEYNKNSNNGEIEINSNIYNGPIQFIVECCEFDEMVTEKYDRFSWELWGHEDPYDEVENFVFIEWMHFHQEWDVATYEMYTTRHFFRDANPGNRNNKAFQHRYTGLASATLREFFSVMKQPIHDGNFTTTFVVACSRVGYNCTDFYPVVEVKEGKKKLKFVDYHELSNALWFGKVHAVARIM